MLSVKEKIIQIQSGKNKYKEEISTEYKHNLEKNAAIHLRYCYGLDMDCPPSVLVLEAWSTGFVCWNAVEPFKRWSSVQGH